MVDDSTGDVIMDIEIVAVLFDLKKGNHLLFQKILGSRLLN